MELNRRFQTRSGLGDTSRQHQKLGQSPQCRAVFRIHLQRLLKCSLRLRVETLLNQNQCPGDPRIIPARRQFDRSFQGSQGFREPALLPERETQSVISVAGFRIELSCPPQLLGSRAVITLLQHGTPSKEMLLGCVMIRGLEHLLQTPDQAFALPEG